MAGLLAACGREAPPPPPPVPVEIAPARTQDTPLFAEYIGDIRAGDEVAVFPRVSGVLLDIGFREGAMVEKGDLLFEIDAPEQATAVDSARAQVAGAEAQAARAAEDVARYEPLLAADAIAAQVFDNAVAGSKAANAQVDAARARLTRAQTIVGYAQVRAPISGRIGKANVDVGALVAPGRDELARISDASRIEVYFSPSEQDMLRFSRLSPEERAEAQTGLKLVLADGSELAESGVIDFADRAVDPATGSYRLRAVFPNPGQAVRPGQFGRLRVKVRTQAGAVIVPDKAVIEQFGTFFVMVVGADNVAEQRRVQAGAHIGGDWVIDDGLKPGERVIVEGLAKVRPGQPVQPLGAAPAARAES
ncbi:MAG: efflux RND transporter periplasmic adaptor subunit [Polymorphobacter sp.]|uniref:efflux RND transporter periplasmic adaptor subunit n=1 Tax=Polymorphobacter sp. TaxID=1909290 RepID=UPI003A89DB75